YGKGSNLLRKINANCIGLRCAIPGDRAGFAKFKTLGMMFQCCAKQLLVRLRIRRRVIEHNCIEAGIGECLKHSVFVLKEGIIATATPRARCEKFARTLNGSARSRWIAPRHFRDEHPLTSSVTCY